MYFKSKSILNSNKYSQHFQICMIFQNIKHKTDTTRIASDNCKISTMKSRTDGENIFTENSQTGLESHSIPTLKSPKKFDLRITNWDKDSRSIHTVVVIVKRT
jgi:hypothetical protein